MTLVGALLAERKGSELAIEVAKPGLQLGAITVFGAVLTQGLRRLNDERDACITRAEIERQDRLKQ